MAERRDKAYWRERVREVGKEATIREEMLRLGFWPPDEEAGQRHAAAMSELREKYAELNALREQLGRLDAELASAQNVDALLAEIRKRRIERVKAEREVRRAERTRAREDRVRQDREWRRVTLPYLGRGVSGGLIYTGGNPAQLAALELPLLHTASDLAGAIGIPEERLAWLTFHRGAARTDHYHRFTIPKRTGGVRVISSPKRGLRTAQRWVLSELLAHQEPHAAATAFRPARSIVGNAAAHQRRAVVLRLDLKDFFPSITFRRVKGLFTSFGYNEGIATLLGLLCTEPPRAAVTFEGQRRFVSLGQRQLPQGACTSPALTNLLCRKLDRRLTGAAEVFGFTYTRYADDLVFSHPQPEARLGAVLALARSILASEGFTVNEAKTAVMRPQHRQVVTGIVVNGDAPRVSREDLRRFRAFLHHVETEGADVVSQRLGRNANAYACGYLSFIHMVNPEQAARLQAKHPWLTRWES